MGVMQRVSLSVLSISLLPYIRFVTSSLPQRCYSVQAKLEHAAERGKKLSASNRGTRHIQQAAMSAPAMHVLGCHQLHTVGPLGYGRHTRVKLWRQVTLPTPCMSSAGTSSLQDVIPFFSDCKTDAAVVARALKETGITGRQ